MWLEQSISHVKVFGFNLLLKYALKRRRRSSEKEKQERDSLECDCSDHNFGRLLFAGKGGLFASLPRWYFLLPPWFIPWGWVLFLPAA
jgi:hypothetical protein